MVFTQEREAEAEAALGPGWRKVEVLKDGNVRKTLAKYWNPEGEEVAVKEVKKLLTMAAGGVKKPEKVARKAKAKAATAEVEGLVECGECSITFSTTRQLVVHKSFHQAKVTMEEETKVVGATLPPPGPPGPPGPPTPAQAALKLCSHSCGFQTKSVRKLRDHEQSHEESLEVEVEAETSLSSDLSEDLGDLSIDNVFESYMQGKAQRKEEEGVEAEEENEQLVELEEEEEELEVLAEPVRRSKAPVVIDSMNIPRHLDTAPRHSLEDKSYFDYDEDEEEDEEYLEEEEKAPEEITLDSEPEEITLDEGDEEEEVMETKEEAEERELAKLVEVEGLLEDPEFVLRMVEGEEATMLANFTSNSWYAAPRGWRPAPGEVWHATVEQLERHHRVARVEVEVEEEHTDQASFLAALEPRLHLANPAASRPALYRLAKALWFATLHPKLPTMKVEQEQEVEEWGVGEEYDEYDEGDYGYEKEGKKDEEDYDDLEEEEELEDEEEEVDEEEEDDDEEMEE